MVNARLTDRKARIKAYKRAAKPILADLAAHGLVLESLSDLINKPLSYPEVVPILIKWLDQVESIDIKETLVRALTVRYAKPMATRPLILEFQNAPISAESFKWAIGNALSVVADDSVFDEIVALVQDKRHGRAREMLAVALGNMKNPKSVEVLIGLLDDEEVAGHALSALRKLAPPEAREAIEPFVNHPKTWIRNEAKRALEKIDKKVARAERKRSRRK